MNEFFGHVPTFCRLQPEAERLTIWKRWLVDACRRWDWHFTGSSSRNTTTVRRTSFRSTTDTIRRLDASAVTAARLCPREASSTRRTTSQVCFSTPTPASVATVSLSAGSPSPQVSQPPIFIVHSNHYFSAVLVQSCVTCLACLCLRLLVCPVLVCNSKTEKERR